MNRDDPDKRKLVRYCFECGSIGPVPAGAIDCCPDGAHAAQVPLGVAEQAQVGFATLYLPPGRRAPEAPRRMDDAKALALQARMLALQARREALKWANVQDAAGAAYSPRDFFNIELELSEVASEFAAIGAQPSAADPWREFQKWQNELRRRTDDAQEAPRV
jgi:hypothetical protein